MSREPGEPTPVSLLQQLRQPVSPSSETAWRRFVKLYTPLLFLWARQIGASEQDAPDLVQEIFLVLARDACLSARSGTALPRLVVDRAAEQVAPTGSGSGRASRPLSDWRRQATPTAPDNVAEFAEEEYRAYLFTRALEVMRTELPVLEWRACQEYLVAGRPAEEVAGELGLTVNQVYLAKSRILRRLRASWKGCWIEREAGAVNPENCPSRDDLRRLLRGELSEAEAAPLERHFASCTACGRLAAVLETEDVLFRTGQCDLPQGEAVERLMDRLEALSAAFSHGPTWRRRRRRTAVLRRGAAAGRAGLRDPGRAGPGRHGRRLQGAADGLNRAGGPEDDPGGRARRARHTWRASRPRPRRSPGCSTRTSSQVYEVGDRRPAFLLAGILLGRQSGRPVGRDAAATGRGGGAGAAGGAGRAAPHQAERDPPRPEAGEHPAGVPHANLERRGRQDRSPLRRFVSRRAGSSPRSRDFGLAKRLDAATARRRPAPCWARRATWPPNRPRASRRSGPPRRLCARARSSTKC